MQAFFPAACSRRREEAERVLGGRLPAEHPADLATDAPERGCPTRAFPHRRNARVGHPRSGRFVAGCLRLLTAAATVLLLAFSGTGCGTLGNPGGSQQYTLTVRNEYALRLLQPIIRYPDGYEHGGVAMVPPGGEAGFVGVNRPLPPYATLFWMEPDGTIIRAVVDVGQKLGRRTTIGEIVFTVQPDRNVVVSWRDFQ